MKSLKNMKNANEHGNPPSPNLSILHKIHPSVKKASIHSSKTLQNAAKKSILHPLNHELLHASAAGDAQQVESLLNKGVFINFQDEKKRSALHFSCVGSHSHITQLLLQHEADVFLKDSVGNTPLHLAVIANNIDNVLLLLKSGADPLIQDMFKRSPLDLVKSRLKLLLKHVPEEMHQVDSKLIQELKQLFEILNYYSLHLHKLDMKSLSARLESLVSHDDAQELLVDLSDALEAFALHDK